MIKSAQDLYNELVFPVCALEEYCELQDTSPIVDTIAIALRKILDDAETLSREEQKHGKKEN